MCISPKWLKYLYIPDFTFGDRKLNITNIKKYLGCIMTGTLSDNNDINRQI